MIETRNSRLLEKITVVLVICCCCLSVQAKYGGGSGTAEAPYLISDASHMNAIGADPCDWGKHFKLMADIDLSSYTGTSFNIIGYGASWYPYDPNNKPFTGVFNGNGHTISNFTYDSNDRDFIGLFGCVGRGYGGYATIKDLGLIDPNVNARTADCVGSLVGWLNEGIISGCFVQGGSVSGTGWDTGGLVGYNDENLIINCYSTAGVSGNNCVGGLVGENDWDEYPRIRNCYSTGSVTGTGLWVGGLVGASMDGGVSVSFWDVNTSGQTTSDGGTPKTTAQMQIQSTFTDVGWDFVNIWDICEGEDYPRLWWEKYGGGNGTEANPYLIRTSCQMNAIGANSNDWDKHFLLCADIDLSEYSGTAFNIIGYYLDFYHPDNKPFNGVFDGNGHTISNFAYTSTDADPIGLFAWVNGGEIKNLGMIDPNVINENARLAVGALVGCLGVPDGGTITNCYVESGSISGDWCVGGLVGWNWEGTISDCYAVSTVTGVGRGEDGGVGGLCGLNDGGTIINCYSGGSVNGENTVGGLCGFNYGTISNCYSTGYVSGGEWDVGGLVGDNYISSITNCHSTASVTGSDRVGGLAGRSAIFARIDNCYSTGSVEGITDVGGLVGRISVDGTITNCYSTGSVSGMGGVGGLVGGNYENGSVSVCYSTSDVNGVTDVGGLMGENYGSVSDCFWDTDTQTHGVTESIGDNQGTATYVSPLTTAQMQIRSTFTDAGWDFVAEVINGPNDIWRMCVDDVNYPLLSWQFNEGDFICPDGVNFFDFSFFAGYWAEDNCGASNDCDGRDLDLLGSVDIKDLRIFADNWLEKE